jgi:predicted aminopeptidase
MKNFGKIDDPHDRVVGLGRESEPGLNLLRLVAYIVLAASLGGCAEIGYYAQAAHGELAVLGSAKPIPEVIADPRTDDKLKGRLQKVQEIRAFAVSELSLPDNGSYKSYADLKRRYVLWNVIATPELSLTARQWCFPVAGCVSYRGYYSEADADAFAEGLRHAGDDVMVGGVPAYSTLGWFSDPVLSTFINDADAELARMIFHELAHQTVYARGDSQFNEAFATAVEEAGVALWLDAHGNEKLRQLYAGREKRETDFLALLLNTRKKLEADYASNATEDEKRARKAAIFGELQEEYQVVKASWGGYTGYDAWFARPLNNANLALLATYHDYVPAFHALLQQSGSFPKFYDAVRELAKLDIGERHKRLKALLPGNQLPPKTE